ncbi:MAG: SDR family NAD(P)-dependent oxidoreductase, partial [Proteobacteria bacterium]
MIRKSTNLFGNMEGVQISRAFELNVSAPLRIMNIIATLFKDKPIRIANISSGAATKAYQGWSVYCSSKAALKMASEVMGKEMESAKRDVKVISYSPGPIDTPMQVEIRKKRAEDFPDVARFISLHSEGGLISAEA